MCSEGVIKMKINAQITVIPGSLSWCINSQNLLHERVYNCACCSSDLPISAIILKVPFQRLLQNKGGGPEVCFIMTNVSVSTGGRIVVSRVQDYLQLQEELVLWFHADTDSIENPLSNKWELLFLLLCFING